VIIEVMEMYRESGTQIMAIGVVNQCMPYMPNSAEVKPDFFDLLVTDPAGTHAVFAPPNSKVSAADYAIGIHASSLVADGGTLQIGIGSLGDAIAQALIVRDRHSAEYQRILEALCPDGLDGRNLDRFNQGLYGCSEMFVNGFLKLIEAGIIRREVFNDAVLQQLLNKGVIADANVTPQTLRTLLDCGRVRSPLAAEDFAFLQRFGVLRPEVRLSGEQLVMGELRCSTNLLDEAAFDVVCQHMLGSRLLGGITMTGGFFLGPRDFYQHLRSMPAHELDKIDMTRIDFINQLYGQEELKRAQRRQARFINTTMIVTLLGAAASDALESGQVVSGVGGQYNFVAMSHALPDSRLIMMLRATHSHKTGVTSSIVWNYGHVTIPRHLRDIVITEYGVAKLRGQPDGEVVKRLIAIADSRFQDELVKQAKAHGKLDAAYQIPERYRNNFPEALQQKLKPWSQAGMLPDFPFGTDLTQEELHLAGALKKLKHASQHPTQLLSLAVQSLWDNKPVPQAYLERLGLAQSGSLKDAVLRRLLAVSL
jgi:acyl-CoA hydrolase